MVQIAQIIGAGFRLQENGRYLLPPQVQIIQRRRDGVAEARPDLLGPVPGRRPGIATGQEQRKAGGGHGERNMTHAALDHAAPQG
ncbi:hypothetical protein D3C80_1786440 [compost metagenome]